MDIFAAINLKNGTCVGTEQDPAKLAETWEAIGVDWLHVVNKDGAFDNTEKTAKNIDSLQTILDRVSVPVQFGGGLRSPEDIEKALDIGVTRVVIGSIAVDRSRQLLDILAKFGPDRIVLGLDVEDDKVAAHGWRQLVETDPLKVAQLIHTAGLRHVIHTDFSRLGTMNGANVKDAVALAQAGNPKPGGSRRFQIIVSGGVADLGDVEKIKAAESDGIEGVIIGKALSTGAIDLAKAMRIAHTE